MKDISSIRSRIPFPFVLEELSSIRPTIKRMFGFTYIYLDHKLLFSLRDSVKQQGTNGIWIYTTSEHLESLAKEFPKLPRRQLWRSGKNCWVVLASKLEDFEEYAFKACELVLNGDRRIGRISRRETKTLQGRPSVGARSSHSSRSRESSSGWAAYGRRPNNRG